jgi:hypothetical protein
MAEQVPNGDRTDRGLQQDVGRVFFLDDHPLAELRDKFCHRIVQAHLAFVNQHHDGRPDEHLRHRSHPENIIFADRFPGLDISVTNQVFVMHLALLVGNDADHPSQFVAVQIRLHRRRHFWAGGRFGICGEAGCGGKHCRQRYDHESRKRPEMFHSDNFILLILQTASPSE